MRGFRVGYKPRDLGRIQHRLKVQVAEAHNAALVQWEHELRLHIKAKPRGCPAWFWNWLVDLVTVQSTQVTKAPNYVHVHKEDTES